MADPCGGRHYTRGREARSRSWWRFPRAGSGWGGTQGHPGERPRHRVRVDAFAIARAPVTNAEYAAFLDATGAPAAAVVGRSAIQRPRSAGGGGQLVRGRRLLRVAGDRDRMAPPVADGGRVGEGRPRRAGGGPLSLGPRAPRGGAVRSAADRAGGPRPTRSGSTPSPACATSGASTGRARLLRGVARVNPRGPGRRHPERSPGAAPGATTTPGVRSPTGLPCRRTCATPTTVSGWCATRARPCAGCARRWMIVAGCGLRALPEARGQRETLEVGGGQRARGPDARSPASAYSCRRCWAACQVVRSSRSWPDCGP